MKGEHSQLKPPGGASHCRLVRRPLRLRASSDQGVMVPHLLAQHKPNPWECGSLAPLQGPRDWFSTTPGPGCPVRGEMNLLLRAYRRNSPGRAANIAVCGSRAWLDHIPLPEAYRSLGSTNNIETSGRGLGRGHGELGGCDRVGPRGCNRPHPSSPHHSAPSSHAMESQQAEPPGKYGGLMS
jgi:hypothetical protein